MQNLPTQSQKLQARKFRRVVAYTLATIFFSIALVGLFYGLQPLLLPLVLGILLAYLFKPLANHFRGTPLRKYSRLLLFFTGLGFTVYWSSIFIKNSMPSDQQKLQLKVRLQYRINERYRSWMGLDKDNKGNILYKYFGDELGPLKKRAVDFLRLSEDEHKQFLTDNEDLENEDDSQKKYYSYYLANLKSQKLDIDKLKATAKTRGGAQVAPQPEKKENTLAAFLHAFSHWLLLPLAFIFILLDKGQILHFFMGLVPNRYFELAFTIAENVDTALGKYIRGTMVECLLVGLTLTVGFFICGVELKIAMLIGLIGGITNAIPFVGTFIACAVGSAYALIAEGVHSYIPYINENNLMIAVVAVVLITHLLDNAIYQPLVVGSAVNIHPLIVILGVFGGSIMFGFTGLIFAIPTIVVIKVVTETLFTGLKKYRII